jgi:hypothetical protein
MVRTVVLSAALMYALPAWAGCDDDDPNCKPTPASPSRPKPPPVPPVPPQKPPPSPPPADPRGCDMDTDCKGDRVCTHGVCQDPLGAAPARPSAKGALSRRDLEKAADTVAAMNSGITATWVMIGIAAPLGTAGVVMGLSAGFYNGEPEIVGGLGAVGGIVAGPIAAGPGARGRVALKRLRLAPETDGIRRTAWITYGLGVATAVGDVGWAIADQGDNATLLSGLGLVPLGLLVTSGALFQSDSLHVRAQLTEVLDEYDIVVQADRPRLELALVPAFDRRAPVGLSIVGTW